MTAFVFPGQGAQKKGMGTSLFDGFKDLIVKADAILGYSLKTLCLEDSGNRLNQTRFTQPALYVVNALSYLDRIEITGRSPDYAAGHSLGEYNALFAAGAVDFETGLRLVKKRAELMAQATGGGMVAVSGFTKDRIETVLKENDLTALDIAGYNTPSQITLAGPKRIIDRAGPIFEAEGARAYIPLRVSGAFHSRYMEDARKSFSGFLEKFEFSKIKFPVISNVAAKPYEAQNIRRLLAEQLVRPVRWTDSIRYLLALGEKDFQEVGPGSVLTGLIQHIRKTTTVPGTADEKKAVKPAPQPKPKGRTSPEIAAGFRKKKIFDAQGGNRAGMSPPEPDKPEDLRTGKDRRKDSPKPAEGADIAIIGVACRFPGAENYDRFWGNLAAGVNSIQDITGAGRWDVSRYYSPDINAPNRTISKWNGLIDNVNLFDNAFFNISPREAKNMDPQQRLLLEETWHCIEDSGVSLAALRAQRTAVYVGVMASDYRQELSGPGILTDSYAAAGNYDAMLANRISYALGLSGASISIDAACAASLVALNGAKRSLAIGESDYALAGGVNLNLLPWRYISFSKSRMLSPDGQCKTFDADANGFVPGEGVGVLLLQRLEDALGAGSHIYGVIKGLAVNHGGQSQSLTAPRVEAQRDAILLAYQEANFSPETVTYVEAHGTGTALGDPIEIEALTRAFRRHTEEIDFCRIGSVKTNIGHLEAAAGMAGVIKVLMMMRHRKIPKSLNLKKINPVIQLEQSPFRVAENSSDWQSRQEDLPLRAGVSSFGMGGVNAHVLLEEAPQRPQPSDSGSSHLFLLSAKTPHSLRRMIEKWRGFVADKGYSACRLKDISMTMLTGRGAFSYRYGCHAENRNELKEILQDQAAIPISEGAGKSICLRIGKVVLENYAQVHPLMHYDTVFKKSLKSIHSALQDLAQNCRTPEDLKLFRELESGFSEDAWSDTTRPVFSFLVSYASVFALTRSVAVPALITGEKSGIWVSLSISGILKPEDALAILTKQKKPEQIELARPVIPFYDPVSGKTFLPYCFTHRYINFLSNELHTEEELFHYYLEKSRLLISSQYTFKKYMEEWNTALSQWGKTIEGMVFDDTIESRQGRQAEGEKLLLTAIIITSLRRLRLKWDLTQQKPVVDEIFNELLDLVTDEVMTRETLSKLLLSADVKKVSEAIAAELSCRQHRMDLKKDYRYIKTQNRTLWEIEDVPAWIREAASIDASLPVAENMVPLEFGEFSEPAESNRPVQLKISGNLEKVFKECLLRLWLRGVDIQWDKIIPGGTFRKVPLPGYTFDRKLFWLNPEKPVISSSAALGGNAATDPFPPEKKHKESGNDRGQEASPAVSPAASPAISPAASGRAEIRRKNKAGICGRGDRRSAAYPDRFIPENRAEKTEKLKERGSADMSLLFERTERFFKEVLSRLIELSAGEIDSHERFGKYGIDSIIVHHFNAEMAQHFESLSKTLLFECQTIHDATVYMVNHHETELLNLFGMQKEKVVPPGESPLPLGARTVSPGEKIVSSGERTVLPVDKVGDIPRPMAIKDMPKDSGSSAATAIAAQLDGKPMDIAIIGINGRYPGAANTDELWDNLKAGKDSVTEIPAGRWNVQAYYDPDPGKSEAGKMYCKWGGFLDDVDKFDPLFFNISPREAELTDPQERLFLETVWELLEDAGYTGETLKENIRPEDGGDVGVFTGVTANTYLLLGPDQWQKGNMAIPTSFSWSIANRVSYIFDFKGPSIPVDTGCASSLTALHLACESLKKRECAIAVAGGVNLYLHPSRYVWLCQMGMLSPSGKCHSFGANADGFAPGEGVGAVLLKPLTAAIRDGDNIHAVIKGSSVNHGGRTYAYMVPNPNAQTDLIRQSLTRSNLDPRTISYVETQGVGSPLGDLIEIAGLTNAHREHTRDKQYCAIGSVKSNIGHLEAAAGIAGLTKVVLQMKHKTLVPSLNSEKLNPEVNFEDSPFYVQHALTPWDPAYITANGEVKRCPRRAGISAFGAGGVNAHVVLEAYEELSPDNNQLSASPPPELIVLSAKNEEGLKAVAGRISAFLEKNAANPESRMSLAHMAWTLQTGREAMDARMAIIAATRLELRRELKRYLQDTTTCGEEDRIFLRDDDPSKQSIIADFTKGGLGQSLVELVADHGDLPKMALLWVFGVDIPWERVHGGRHLRKISLPTYPFNRKRYWIPDHSGAEPGPRFPVGKSIPKEETPDLSGPRLPVGKIVRKEETSDIPGHRLSVGKRCEKTEPQDVSGLRLPVGERAEKAQAPEENLQSVLRGMVAGLLKLAQAELDTDRNLREYGFDSLAGMKLIHRIEDRYGTRISPAALFRHNTIEALAAHLWDLEEVKAILTQATEENRVMVSPGGGADESDFLEEPLSFPLSSGQKGLWMIDQVAPGNYAYNTPCAFRIEGRVQPEALKRAFEQIVLRHPALRSTFRMQGDLPQQVIEPGANFSFETQNISHLSEAEADTWFRSMVRKPFDLEKGPLMRVHLFLRHDKAHLLLIIFHHIIFDGSSVSVMLRDLLRLYEGQQKGQVIHMPPPASSYGDFVAWQTKMLEGEAGREHRRYWQEKLSGELPVLNLPMDRSRPPFQTYSGEVHSAEISSELAGRLKSFAEEEKASVYSVCLGVFNVLLFRYTQQEDIIVGTPFEGRPRTEFEELIGYFVNMVVLRTAVSGESSFRQILNRVQADVLEAMAHLDYPFAELVREMGSHQDRSRSPLFQVAFAFQNWVKDHEGRLTGKADRQNSLVLTPEPGIHQEGEFDLTLEIVETENRYRLFFKYNPDLFDAATIERMAGHFLTLTQGVVSGPDRSISQLPLLTDAEKHRLLVTLNDTEAAYPEDRTIHQLFEAQAERSPDATAVVFQDRQLTYRQLNTRSNQLARHLKALAVGPEVRVGICMERSFELVTGLLGILKAGGAYVPLDPAYPKDRLEFMLKDADVPVLLTIEKLIEDLPDHGAHTVCLDRDWEAIGRENEANPHPEVTAGNAAYVIYTSGSTGKPKGTIIVHRGLVNYLSWCTRAYEVKDGCGAPVHSSIGFDATITSLYSPLLVGGKVILVPEEDEIEHLCRTLRSETNFSLIKITPAHLEILGRLLPDGAARHARALIIGGEALTGKNISFWLANAPETRIINEYGPTETVVGCCIHEATAQDATTGAVPIGRPIANTQLYILDRYLQPVPVGVAGELHIGGAGLARGYLNRPALTEEKFIPNPFSDEPGSRLYKTGDLARYLPDGNIDFMGRIDNQVKIRGFRIELGEIEAVLTEHAAVREAAVIVREDRPGDKRILAYVVADEEKGTTAGDLRDFLKKKLPDHMVPSAFVLLSAFPLTPNGKVDRRKLPEPDTAAPGLLEAYSAPGTPDEERLSLIWAEVLGLDRVGINDNFFDIGGHSLLAVRLVTLIEEKLGTSLPVSSLFQAPTISDLARTIGKRKATDLFTPLVKMQPPKENLPLFCVHPGDGNIFCYTQLVRQLGDARPFYGLQAFGIEPGTTALCDIEDMAAKYIERIQSVQSTGPYYIGGLCAGGTIAFEIAQQLKGKGERVALLALFDSLAPHLYTPIDDVAYFMGFARDFDGLSDTNLFPLYCEKRKIDPGAGIDGVRRDLQSLSHGKRLHLLWECAQEAGIFTPEVSIEYLDRVFKVYSGISRGLLNYTARPYDGRIALFRALDEIIDPQEEQAATRGWIDDPASLKLVRKFRDDPFLGWNRNGATPIEVYDVPGNHFTMLLQPHVEVLEKQLSKCLEQ